jgi:dolichol-phosphate mannosyltransferase
MSAHALVIIPTYNEADNLEPLVRDIVAQGLDLEILVVDDNSPDGTGTIADRLAVESPAVHVLHRQGKEGYGTAYIAGCRWALARDYQRVLSMDCDYSHHPRYLPALLAAARDADLVIGSRYVPGGGTVNWGWSRRLISAGGNLLVRLTLGLRVHDCTAGFRCFRRDMAERVPWNEIRLTGYGFLVGAVYHVQRLGGRIVEVPITFEDRRVGQSKMSPFIVAEALAFVARLTLRRGRTAGARLRARARGEAKGIDR